MNIRVFLYHVCLPLVCAACVFGAYPSILHAAEAQSAPVAQKKPAAQKKPVAKSKVQPRANASHLTEIEHSAPKTARPEPAAATQTASAKPQTQTKAAAAPQQAQANDKIQHSLDTFAKSCIASMNKQRKPGIHQKEVKRQPDGTFMARYVAVDPDSLQTSYNETEGSKTISHIGRMDYHEVEYVCIGKSQKQALAGPFNEVNRSPVMELIKYKRGKWSY
ncbi:MAG: hypothetical protein DELT_02123 [Desulfovibrio sp.]